jgi:hypothetical protein
MVIDNADAFDDLFGQTSGEVDDAIVDALLLSRPGTAMILYTSRHARVGMKATEDHCVSLDVLS